MGAFDKGEIVLVEFPNSDLTKPKVRPALVLATLAGKDIIICLITSKNASLDLCIAIGAGDLSSGELRMEPSYVRPVRLFTAHSSIIIKKLAKLSEEKTEEIIRLLADRLNQKTP